MDKNNKKMTVYTENGKKRIKRKDLYNNSPKSFEITTNPVYRNLMECLNQENS